MITKVYSKVSISEYKRMYFIKDEDVESKYLSDESALANIVKEVTSFYTIQDSDKVGTGALKITVPSSDKSRINDWNIVAFTNEDSTSFRVYMMLYDNQVYNTQTVGEIRINISSVISPQQSTETINAELTLQKTHISTSDDAKYGLSNTSDQYTHKLLDALKYGTNSGDKSFSIQDYTTTESGVTSPVTDISMTTYKGKLFSSSYQINAKLLEWIKNKSPRYFLSGTLSAMYVIAISGSQGIVTTLNNHCAVDGMSDADTNDYYLFDIPIDEYDIEDFTLMCILENGRAMISTTKDGNIQLWLKQENDAGVIKLVPVVIPQNDTYDYIIPSYIDITGCYLRIPKLSKDIPLTYETIYWRSLLYESNVLIDNNISSKQHPEYDGAASLHDSILSNKFTEQLISTMSQNYSFLSNSTNIGKYYSPVAYSGEPMNTRSETLTDGYMLDLNNKMLVLTYIDLIRNYSRGLSYLVCRDCGIDAVYEDNSRYFVKYLESDRYNKVIEVPLRAVVSNLCYFDNDSLRVYSMVDDSYSRYSYNVYDSKYGMTLDKYILTEV